MNTPFTLLTLEQTVPMLLDPSTEPMLADHKVNGLCVIPAALMLDMTLYATRQQMLEHSIRLRSVSFQQPISVAPNAQHRAQLIFNGRGECRIKTDDVTHFAAKVETQIISAPVYQDLAKLRFGCNTPISHGQIHDWYKSCGIEYGTTYRTIQQLNIGKHSAIGLLRVVHDYNTEPHWVCPTILDGALQLLGIAVTLTQPPDAGPFFPWFIQSVTAKRPIQGPVWCKIDFEEAQGDVIRGRCALYNPQGEELLIMNGVRLKRSPNALRATIPQQKKLMKTAYLQAVRWNVKPLQTSSSSTEVGTWLVLRDTSLLADKLSHWLIQQGHRVIEISCGEAPLQISSDVFVIRPNHKPDYTNLLETLDQPVQGIVHLWNTQPPQTENPAEALRKGVHSVTHLIQTLAPRQRKVALWLLTTGAQAVDNSTVYPTHAAIWGLGRVIDSEHSGYEVRMVDLPDNEHEVVWSHLRSEMAQPSADREVVYHEGQRYCPTTESTEVDNTATELLIHASGCYVLIGGYGGIGQVMARHLVRRGALRLVLVHTSAFSAEKQAFATELEQQGIHVHSVRGDIGDADFVFNLLTNAQDAFGRINGILHCAGVLRDGLLRKKSSEHIQQVLHPKVQGSWTLSQFAPLYSPDFIILFSSISGVYGNFGQSIYAAANTYQDALAQQKGLPWMSLSWGLWGEIGMGVELVEQMKKRNIFAFSTVEGVAAFDEALRNPEPHWILMKRESKPTEEINMPYPSQITPTTTKPTDNVLEQRIVTLLQDTLRTNRITLEDTFLEIGLDSMLAVEIVSEIGDWGYDVDPSLFFELPTVRALVEHLAAETSPQTTAEPQTTRPEQLAPATPEPDTRQPVYAHAENEYQPSPPNGVSHQPAIPSYQQPAPHVSGYRPTTPPAPFAPQTTQLPPNPQSQPMTPQPHDDAYRPSSAAAVWLNRPTKQQSQTTTQALPRYGQQKSFFQQRLDALNEEDYEIRARGDYFYEPVILASEGGWITTAKQRLLNFATYSYLDLISHPYINAKAHEAIALQGTGTHGVRLLAGTTHIHRDLEQTIAQFKHTDDAIAYSSGYTTNMATVATLVGPGDYVIGDVYNHASIIDGCNISGATFLQFAHNNMRSLERCLQQAGSAGKLVVADAVFSMDGDIIDLPSVSRLCKQYDAALMIDEAHSVGVLGKTGRGIEEHFGLPADTVQIKMGTLSKTIPSAGGYVAGSHDLIFALKNNARGFMFSAAITPAQAAAAKAAFEVIQAEPQRVARLNQIVQYYISSLNKLGFDTMKTQTPIVPIVCQSDEQAYQLARLCQREGLFVQPIIYPAVPRKLPRLRTIVTSGHSEQDLATAIDIMARAARQVGLIR